MAWTYPETDSKQDTHPLVLAARQAVEEYVRTGKLFHPATPPLLETPSAGVFVSIKKNGELRGCIGTIEPRQDNVIDEVIWNAISACSRDPRFFEVTEDELDQLTYSVDVLSPPEQIAGLDDLDPHIYGVIVEAGGRRGLLLPDLEGVDSVEQQLAHAMGKAGIIPGEPLTLYRFTVARYR